jgi:hypothetical protein
MLAGVPVALAGWWLAEKYAVATRHQPMTTKLELPVADAAQK